MVPENREKQLELFQVGAQSVRRPAREAWGHLWFPLRYDQVVLVGIGGLLGLTVIFAVGVERGKELARGEQPLLARRQGTIPAAAKPSTAATSDTPAVSVQAEAKVKASTATPVEAPKPKSRTKVAEGGSRSRYAVQVVTYSQPSLAKQELDRLHARGESAFLVMRNGRTIVYVGPFPSKDHASEKVMSLKPRYGDCFVRTL